MEIKSVQLPGIGRKISIITAENSMIVLIVHHTGKRDLYFFEEADDDAPDFSMTLNSDETRELGAQLLGAMYQPADADKMRMFRKKIQLEWIELVKGSELVGKTIGESEIRTKTGASVIGIIKGEDVIAAPDVDVVLDEGDILMAAGKQDQIGELSALCNGGEQV